MSHWSKEGQATQWSKEEGQATQWPKEGQATQRSKEKRQTTQWPKEKGQATQWQPSMDFDQTWYIFSP
jgi:hypothetical protein